MPCYQPPRWTPEVAEFLALVEATSRDLGEPLSCTSWFRTVPENVRVGGDPHSQHLMGLAVDVLPPQDRKQRTRLLELARSHGLVPIDEGDHVHLQRYDASPPGAYFAAEAHPADEPRVVGPGALLPACGCVRAAG